VPVPARLALPVDLSPARDHRPRRHGQPARRGRRRRAHRDGRVADDDLHLAAVDDRGALRRDLPRAPGPAAGPARRAAAGGRGGRMRSLVARWSPWTWLVVAGWAF